MDVSAAMTANVTAVITAPFEFSRVTMDSKEAAQYLGISYWLCLELVKRGELPAIRLGGRILFRKSSLDHYLDLCEGLRGDEKHDGN